MLRHLQNLTEVVDCGFPSSRTLYNLCQSTHTREQHGHDGEGLRSHGESLILGLHFIRSVFQELITIAQHCTPRLCPPPFPIRRFTGRNLPR